MQAIRVVRTQRFHFSFPLKPRTVLQQGDVLKVDIGVHVKGRIADSAFTMTFDHNYDKLLEAVKAATDTGIRVRNLNGCMLHVGDC